MAIQNEPTRIQIPFADSGTKNVIPDTNSTPSASQAASWTDGFPAQCSLPLSAGGIPPARADFNGIFNTMTQSERFTQEGGVWAWDATVDYGTNRMVLGSDNKIYWSIAQSGPNLGGAQDPTADNGTYWSTMPMRTPPLADDTSNAATTEWVKDLAGASIYVDSANGSDSNGGFTQTDAVKTIAKAMSIAGTIPGQAVKIYLAAGTYSENVSFESMSVVFVLQGNVTIAGYINVANLGYLYVSGSSYTLSVSGPILCISSSCMIFRCALTVSSSSNTRSCIDIEDGSYCVFYSVCSLSQSAATSADGIRGVNNSGAIFYEDVTLSCNGDGTNDSVHLARNSTLRFMKSLAVSGSGCLYGIYISSCSSLNATGALTVAQGVVATSGMFIGDNSCFVSDASVSHVIHGGTTGAGAVVATRCSAIDLGGNASLTIWNHGTTRSLYLFNGAVFMINVGESLIFQTETGKTPTYLLDCYGSIIEIGAGAVLNFGTATVTRTVEVTFNGVFYLSASATVSGTITGSRFIVDYGGQFYVQGAGDSRIPGSTAGSIASASYGYYH